MDVERYVCRIVNRGSGSDSADCGSGVIARIGEALWGELLAAPSCFKEKYRRSISESRGQSFYVLLTAHSSLYRESKQEKPLKTYIDTEDYRLRLDGSEIPLCECIVAGASECCIAVSCCGIDSILVLCDYDDVLLDYSLKSHGCPEKCSIASNFLLLFLSVDAVNKYIADCSPPVLENPQHIDVAGGCNVRILWRTAEGKVLEKPLEDISSPVKETYSHSGSLQQSMCQIREKGSFGVPKDAMTNTPCCIGAPVILQATQDDGAGTPVVGIYAGEGRITSLYGIFGILKGGLGHFLGAVVPNPTTRTVMPSRWKYHITAFVGELQTCSDVLELFHLLLYRGCDNKTVRILKFSLDGGAPTAEIVSGLEIFTAIFRSYRELDQGEDSEVHNIENLCSEDCTWLEQIHSDISQISAHFAEIPDPPESIAIALFECVESMQYFNYQGVANRVLREIREHLDIIAVKRQIDSNDSVNKSFKWIDILAHKRERSPCQGKPPIPTSTPNGREKSIIV